MAKQSNISRVIAQHNLKPGDIMRTVAGIQIDNSVVLTNYNVLIKSDRDSGGYDLYSENTLSGEETQMWLPQEAVDAIRQTNF